MPGSAARPHMCSNQGPEMECMPSRLGGQAKVLSLDQGAAALVFNRQQLWNCALPPVLKFMGRRGGMQRRVMGHISACSV